MAQDNAPIYNMGRTWHYRRDENGKKVRDKYNNYIKDDNLEDDPDHPGKKKIVTYPTRIIHVADPKEDMDAVNKKYVDVIKEENEILKNRVAML